MTPNRARVSLPEFAEIIGVSRSYAWKLADRGVIAKPIDGTVALGPALRRYLKHLANPAVDTGRRSALTGEQTRKLKMENDSREREIVPADAVIALAEALVGAVDDELTGWADRATRDREVRTRLKREVQASHRRIRATMAATLRETLAGDIAEEIEAGAA